MVSSTFDLSTSVTLAKALGTIGSLAPPAFTAVTAPGVDGVPGADGVSHALLHFPVKLGFLMTIQDQIEADLKDAMRAKQAERLSVLRMAKSALMNATIEKYGAGGKLSDPEAVVVIRKQVKQREDSIAGFEKGGRLELAEKERREMEVLGQYLPKPLSEAEIAALVQEAISESKATSKAQLGQAMKIATEKAAGRVDGKTLSQHIRDALP
jgi:uncharacterized protein